MALGPVAGEAPASPHAGLSLARTKLAAAKAVMYLCLARFWVGLAVSGAGALILTVAGPDCTEHCPVFNALLAVKIKALIFAMLLALVTWLLVLHAAVLDAGFRAELRKASEASESFMREAALRLFLAALPFVLLAVPGCLLLLGLSPTKESLMGRIGAWMVEVWVVVTAVICCFVFLPGVAMKLRRMKLGNI
ncbi:hypothetical protein QOZ80_8BG0659550 [Eleusine coracana subsp. coracana]|nr:hypothetical protein QOZ80_8BG0659550 [Eleusine coracana subsp. coracana]